MEVLTGAATPDCVAAAAAAADEPAAEPRRRRLGCPCAEGCILKAEKKHERVLSTKEAEFQRVFKIIAPFKRECGCWCKHSRSGSSMHKLSDTPSAGVNRRLAT